MRSERFGLLLFLLLFSLPMWSQQAPMPPFNNSPTGPPVQFPMPFTPPSTVRDPQALTILQNSISAMGSTVPVDSTATGSVTIVAGTKTDYGTIQILTRGIDQSSDQITLPDQTISVIYSRGQANEIVNGVVKYASVQLTASSQSSDFPLPFLAAALSATDLGIQYIGEETINGLSYQHIQIWHTFSANQNLQRLWSFTVKDIWVDPATWLPFKIAYERREAGGASPRFRIEVLYSNWQTVGGAFYPYQIQKSWNGMPWTSITIQNVALQTGLTDSNFPVISQKVVQP
jgi:hypothetical protein